MCARKLWVLILPKIQKYEVFVPKISAFGVREENTVLVGIEISGEYERN